MKGESGRKKAALEAIAGERDTPELPGEGTPGWVGFVVFVAGLLLLLMLSRTGGPGWLPTLGR